MTIKRRICSFGGVGSTEILCHIENHDRERIREHSKRKHTIDPRMLEDMGTKRAAFIFGNPYNSILSVFRRGYQENHEINMNFGKMWHNSPDEMERMLTKNTTVEEYLDFGRDLFNMEEHLDNWIGYSGKIEILLIRYESMQNKKNIDLLMNFLGCCRSFKFIKRFSDWNLSPLYIRNGLEKVYGRIKQKIDEMPDVILKMKKVMM